VAGLQAARDVSAAGAIAATGTATPDHRMNQGGLEFSSIHRCD
jgi:hypothetical protein